MQETPNFTNYQARYNSVDRYTVLDSREVIANHDRKFLESLYVRLDLYFGNSDFRYQIPIDARVNLEDGYLTSVLSYLENIANWQRDGSTPVNGSNLTSQIQSINSILPTVDQILSGYYYTYFSNDEPLGKKVQSIQSLAANAEQEVQSLHDVVENIKNQANDRKQAYDASLSDLESRASVELEDSKSNANQVLNNINQVLTKAQLLLGRASGHQLGDYYHKLANGRTSQQQAKFNAEKGKKFEGFINALSLKKFILAAIILVPIAYSVVMFVIYNPIQINAWLGVLLIIVGSAATLAALFYLVVRSIVLFGSRFPGGHERTSVLWMIGAIVSTIFTAIYSGLLIRDLATSGPITWEEIIPKVIVLLAPAYLVRLCVQNYRANAHLMVQYMHRATIMNIAESYSQATAPDANKSNEPDLVKISHEARMMILTDAAKIMFAQSESGYITQKEGAGGNGDNMIDSLQRGLK